MRKTKLYLLGMATAMLGPYAAQSQSPGGVPVAAWYRADAGTSLYSDAGTLVSADSQTVYQWNDYQGSGYNLLQASAGARPLYSNAGRLANFNPTVTFDGTNDWMQYTAPAGVSIIDRADGTVYAAGFMNQQKRSGFAGFHASMDFPGLHVFSDYKLLFFTSGGPGYQGVSTDVMTAQTHFIAGSSWENRSTSSFATAVVSLNGVRTSYDENQIYNVNLTAGGSGNFRIGQDNNWGAFSGQLNEILVFENSLTAAQMDRVETYLAVKYGMTYAQGTKNYVNSTGDVVWDAASHNGYHYNIAGIARDNAGALHQKQSWSTNAGQQILIATTGLAQSNSANTVELADGQYLVWGDNGEAKTPSVPVSGLGDINYHFASIWKVQNTGAVGTVRIAWPKGLSNLTLIQSSDTVIDASDAATPMTNEITVNGVVYNYADVTLADGSYFTLGAKMATPGGVSADLRVWLRADVGFTPAEWTDLSGNANHYTQTHINRQPFIAADMQNFNPVADFGNTGSDARFMVVPSGKPYSANSTSSTIFAAALNRSTPTYSDIIGFGNTTESASLTQANDPVFITYGRRLRLYPYTASSSSALPELEINKLYLADMSFTFGTSGIRYGLNGQTTSVTSSVAASNAKFAEGSILGSQPEARNGAIGEIIAYERELSDSEKQQVRSYLGIKYGHTLPFDYIASDGTTIVWDRTANDGYNNNIFGVAHDEASQLHQKQSRSINDNQQLIISTTGLANSNSDNEVGLSEGQFLIVGDNGLSQALASPHEMTSGGGAELNLRFAAVWKAENTGGVGTVRIAWPVGVTNIHLIQSDDDEITTADAHTSMDNIIVINGMAYNYADAALENGSYFTFAGYIAGPGGVGQDLSLWYKADNGVQTNSEKRVTSWSSTTINDVTLTPNSSPYILYNDQSNTWNFNPTVTFDGTNNYLRNTTTDYLNTAGSVHYITVARLSAATGVYRNMFSLSGNDDGFFLHVSGNTITPMPTINNYVNPSATGPASSSRFGIYSAILPRSGTTPNQRGFYNGLEKIYTSAYPRTGSQYSIPSRGAYMGADGTTGDNFLGEIAEVVLYHEPEGGDMTNTDLHRIHSYLAIKYGITLDQTAPQDYVNSSSMTVWDAETNAEYNNNIAGIGRDDEGSLYQKQSMSVNPAAQVLISSPGLANTNATNSGVLANGQFLIWGDNGLAKSPSVAITGVADVNYRFASVWKVENTNSVGTVRVAWRAGYANLTLLQGADSTFSDSYISTPMTNTQMVNGVEYAYADVTLEDGQYFTFAAFVQAPGGVTNGLSHWYRADKLLSTLGEDSNVTSWTDFTSGVTSSEINGAPLPKYKKGAAYYFNYNPGVNFTAIQQMFGNISEQTVNSLDFDIFTLTKEGMAGTRFFNIGMNNTTFSSSNWDQPGLYINGNIARRNNTGSGLVIDNPGNIGFASSVSSIMYHKFTDTSMRKGLNGDTLGTARMHASMGTITGGHIIGSNGGVNPPGGDDWGFTGHIGEIVVYGNGSITAVERNKVETYLAIKYGITLHSDNNYTTSGDVVVWSAADNTAHYNNVAGIGHDFISALHQKQSRSQHANVNDQLIISLGEIAETNADNPNTLPDGQFLVWGDNGNTQAMTNTASTFTAFEYAGSSDNGRRMNRVWKVQNTGVDHEVLMSFPVASVGTTTFPEGDECADYVIVFADDTAFTVNVSVKALEVSEDELDYQVLHTFTDGYKYFTYAKVKPYNQGTVYLPEVTEVSDTYADPCDIGEWKYFRNTSDNSQKLLGMSGYSSAELDNFEVHIVPEGVVYEGGAGMTRLMPRITTIIDSNESELSNGKVRIYYRQAELDETIMSGALTNGWFKYSGTADEAITDIYSDGVFDPLMAVAMIPDAYGEEDGESYVEFHNVSELSSSFVYISSTFDESQILDVSWLYFTADVSDGAAVLRWATASEHNNKGFEIERSGDARSWTVIGFVGTLSEDGNSYAPLSYSYTDAAPLKGTNFYRLKQVDINGDYKYSEVRSVRFSEETGIVLIPNPTSGVVSISGLAAGQNQIVITNAIGQQILKTSVDRQTEYRLDLSRFPSGHYYVSVRSEDGQITNLKLIKQ